LRRVFAARSSVTKPVRERLLISEKCLSLPLPGLGAGQRLYWTSAVTATKSR
jgi:hypothetical protein